MMSVRRWGVIATPHLIILPLRPGHTYSMAAAAAAAARSRQYVLGCLYLAILSISMHGTHGMVLRRSHARFSEFSSLCAVAGC